MAASEYAFPGLRDVEMADFTQEQVLQYAQKWFGDAARKYESFADDLKKSENAGLAELCNVPLLLSLLCLYYDDAQNFPARRAELYEDALDALLRKWDSSRQIQRDEIYKNLSHKRKQQMFAHIATPAFEKGRLYFSTQQLADAISHYLSNLPGAPPVDEIDGEAVLRAIEAQHGVLVERAHNIHSFSHLSFQEYFTARYIVENEARGTTNRLIREHLTNPRWREVVLLTASMLDNASSFASELALDIENLVGYGWLAEALRWSESRIEQMDRQNKPGVFIGLRLAYVSRSRVRTLRHYLLEQQRAIEEARPLARVRARELARTIEARHTPNHIPDLELAQSLEPNLAVDYSIYCIWVMASVLAWSRQNYEVQAKYLASILKNIKLAVNLCVEAGDEGLGESINRIPLPQNIPDPPGWRTVVHEIWILMEKERGYLPLREISPQEYFRLTDYFYANELLINCLDLAYVTNRQEILDNLLRPPGALTAP